MCCHLALHPTTVEKSVADTLTSNLSVADGGDDEKNRRLSAVTTDPSGPPRRTGFE